MIYYKDKQMEKLSAKDRIKEYYEKKLILGGVTYTIVKKGSKNSYLTWISSDDGNRKHVEFTNEQMLDCIDDGTWIILKDDIEQYYNRQFYVRTSSQMLYKIERNDESTCYVTISNTSDKSKERGIHYNHTVLENFRTGIWVLYDKIVDTTVRWVYYEVPYDLFNGEVKKGDYYELYTNELQESYGKPVKQTSTVKYILPREILLTWACTSNIVDKPVLPKDLTTGDWVVVLKDDPCYYNCEKEKAQEIHTVHKGDNYIKLNFSDGSINSYQIVRMATKQEIAQAKNPSNKKDANIFTVLNNLKI